MDKREQIQTEALQALVSNIDENSTSATIVMSPGTGKSKVAIDYVLRTIRNRDYGEEYPLGPLFPMPKLPKVLVTSPRTTLKDEWKSEVNRWFGFTEGKFGLIFNMINIQEAYKWSKEELSEYNIIIADEIHTYVTEEYGNLIINAKELGIPLIGLTGTPDDKKIEKAAFYFKYCPIVYKYLDSAKDGIINKRKYIVYEHELTDDNKVQVGYGKKKWLSAELKQYTYLQERVDKAEADIRKVIIKELKDQLPEESDNPFLKVKREDLLNDIKEIETGEKYISYFAYASRWKSSDDSEKKSIGYDYTRSISNRQEFLWSLPSTAFLSKIISKYILEQDTKGKVLVFSERTKQASVISSHVVHSKNKKDVNDKNLKDFDDGVIRQLGSCYSLTLGLNLKNAKYAILESYNGSDVQFAQRTGRVDRLPVDENAIIIIMVVKGTQAETWYNRAVKFKDEDIVKVVTNTSEFIDVFNKFKS